MSKYKLNQEDLQIHWNDQLGFINSSIEQFDKGNESEARRIATSLRIIFHKSRSSNPLISQIDSRKNFYIWSSGGIYIPVNSVSSWTLLSLSIDKCGINFKPQSDLEKTIVLLKYLDWWNEIIFDDKYNVFTRKDIIGFVANQDGGAHVDSDLDEKYAALTKHNSLGWTDQNGNKARNNPAYNAIRQIAQELLISDYIYNMGSYTRKKIESSPFEMKFVDQNRRFKVPKSDSYISEKIFAVKNESRKENRTSYLQEYVNGTKVILII